MDPFCSCQGAYNRAYSFWVRFDGVKTIGSSSAADYALLAIPQIFLKGVAPKSRGLSRERQQSRPSVLRFKLFPTVLDANSVRLCAISREIGVGRWDSVNGGLK